ncbi:MAG: hypothetical protein Q9227_009429 [Pyrenula ochraceoflavens]
MANRYSSYSQSSTPAAARSPAQQSTQVSTTTLLNALHTIYTSGEPYQLDASTSLAVNTWLTAVLPSQDGSVGGALDKRLAVTAWEHARRRAEDGCIILGSLHQSTPSLLVPFLSAFPLEIPPIVQTALVSLRPFLTCVTPYNASTPRHSALAVKLAMTLPGKLTGLSLALSKSGIDVSAGLLNIPSEPGFRAFDVFYYLLTSASTPAEREYLGLRTPNAYSLLNKSNTYSPPSYLPTADDAAAAEDFRAALKAIGIKGAAQRGLLSVLAGLLKLGETTGFLVDSETLEDICEDVSGLLGVEPEILMHKCDTGEREVLIAGIYEALVDWVIDQANSAIQEEFSRIRSANNSASTSPLPDEDLEDGVCITVIDIPGESLGKAIALRGVFDDSLGINAEMKEDGVEVLPAGHSVLKEMSNVVAEVAADLGVSGGPLSREREYDHDRRQNVLEKVGVEAESDSFLKQLLYPIEGEHLQLGQKGRFDLPSVVESSRVWYQLSLHPTDEDPSTLASKPTAWSAGTVSRQLRAWRLPEWANRRNKNLDFTADFDVEEFCSRYASLGCSEGKDGVESWILQRGWSNGEVVIGHERIWMREAAWWEAESMLDLKAAEQNPQSSVLFDQSQVSHNPFDTGHSNTPPVPATGGFFPPVGDNMSFQGSRDNLLGDRKSMMGGAMDAAKSIAPTVARTIGGDYGLGPKGDDSRNEVSYFDHETGQWIGALDPEFGDPKHVESKPTSKTRQIWVGFVWTLTFWIPSFILRYVGRMKRPDVRMAWREKLVLMMLIFLLNAFIIFYIVEFGLLLCPNFDKAFNNKEVSYHQGDNDFYVSIHGNVYDITKFWKVPHGMPGRETTKTDMQPFAGLNLDAYFPPPLSRACPGLNIDDTVVMQNNDTNAVMYPQALHTSGPILQANPKSGLHSWDWYSDKFLPKIKEYYKGELVYKKSDVHSQGQNDGRQWVIIDNGIYDLTNYFYTQGVMDQYHTYMFFPSAVEDIVKNNPGTDVTDQWQNTPPFLNSLNCMKNAFYVGKLDFRDTPKCQVNSYILLAFALILCAVILTKFLAALQFGSKRRPVAQDKFVICQVPAYTEGEDQLRKGLDSLTALQYDNKRKLICVICDGMIVGAGNDRPTPKIVLDVLGVDPKTDPPALPFKSVGNGSEQLNYGKVYSGLYEYEGNVVPYIVVVKVGKESEQSKSKPGNRGKRDSQILLLQFLNRVHHRSAMSPLELEMFHQINNIIGVDPELYEYLLMVDADTSVREDSLNRLVASCANDAKIAGICGETSLENEERSWWTMIQVYEYYISHHLAKAFESLFGSVTCLPGCFCMYRLRTADKGRPLIISDKVIHDYADCDVDTLHKKNLLALGEDRFLTTLMTKYFPAMRYKFVPDAFANTAAPETCWGNTRIVIGEKGNKQIIATDDDGFDPRSIPLQRWDDYALANNLPGRRGAPGATVQEKFYPEGGYTDDPGMEMDDMHSQYSSVRPASTVLTGFPRHQSQYSMGMGPYMAPPPSQSPVAFTNPNRMSTMTGLTQFRDAPMSVHGRPQSAVYPEANPFSASRPSMAGMQSSDNLLSPQIQRHSTAGFPSRPTSSVVDFRSALSSGPDEGAIVEAVQSVMNEVDLDNVTKKQVRALVEQRLQTELPPDKRAFLDRQIDVELALI